MSKKSSRGFTLIELIVVVAIIGIISAVGTVAYQGYTKGAKESAVSSLVQQTSLGQLEYYSNTGGYFISDGASTTACTADEDTSAAIEDMIFGNADGTTNVDSPNDDPNQFPDDIEFQFCAYGDAGTVIQSKLKKLLEHLQDVWSVWAKMDLSKKKIADMQYPIKQKSWFCNHHILNKKLWKKY